MGEVLIRLGGRLQTLSRVVIGFEYLIISLLHLLARARIVFAGGHFFTPWILVTKMATVQFTNQYSEDLFGCFDDINTCVYGFFCTPCLVGQSAEDSNVGKCFDTACCLVAWNLVPYVGGCISACKTAEIMNKVSAKLALPHISRSYLPCLPHQMFVKN